MEEWVLLLIADDEYIQRAFRTIRDARSIGEWTEDIVLMTSDAVLHDPVWRSKAALYRVSMTPTPSHNFDSARAFWSRLVDHPHSEYAQSRPNICAKFNMMDVYFRRWDMVFYLDAGASIFGPLHRFRAHTPRNKRLYAHSDAYPTFEWRLTRQFELDLVDDSTRDAFHEAFDTDCDYFQSTLMIFDTRIIEDSTVTDLLDLLSAWPMTIRGDQGIFNLLFTCKRRLWTPLPTGERLYDFFERDGRPPYDYTVLKYPHQKTLAEFYDETVAMCDRMEGGWAELYYGIFSRVVHEHGYRRIAEVGIGYGAHAKHILRASSIDHLFLIDPMVYYPNDGFIDDITRHTPKVPHSYFDEMVALITDELSPWRYRYTWIRKRSLDVVEIEDGTLDAVFLDADHRDMRQDLEFWYRKLRVGGRLVGDDYWMTEVAEAVHEFEARHDTPVELIHGKLYPIFCFEKKDSPAAAARETMKITMRLEEWQHHPKRVETMIVQASSTNGNDDWQPFPIGMSWRFVAHHDAGLYQPHGPHDNLVLCAIAVVTDQNRRPHGLNRCAILDTLSRANIHNMWLDDNEYYRILPHFRFVISPEGNGIDCHRHYEALMAGCIPIVEDNEAIRSKYEGCPILYTKDYSEITTEYLEQKYIEMLTSVYSFERLFYDFYPVATRAKIRFCSNHWTKALTGKKWY